MRFGVGKIPSKAVFIMNVIPAQVPAEGPNYFNFDDEVFFTHFTSTRTRTAGPKTSFRIPLRNGNPANIRQLGISARL